ncbi:MAG TPA: hypothetical protein DHV14_00875 [Micrococcales bacterium]|uniref:hypothetical protein n=1 Tax=Miniimonas arenae TaxID=676201 RepID=UPI000EEFF2DC|nr:hypothetical protein [Miniimonas arenae]HCX83700.1 hypothetical protein [Micrococcales bacterium]
MDYPDAWTGLTAPRRGLAMAPRALPVVIRSTGHHRDEVRTRVAKGAARRLRRGVATDQPAPGALDRRAVESEHLLHMSAVRERLPRPVFCERSAALLLGLWVLDPAPPVHVLQRTHVSSRARSDTRLRRHLDAVPETDLRTLSTTVVTSVERTLVDCARTQPERNGIVLADSAFRLGADRVRVEQILEELAGARGVRRARAVIARADGEIESPGESVVRYLAESAGLGRPTAQCVVETDHGRFEVDLGWPERRVGIEFDGAMKYPTDDVKLARRRMAEDQVRHDALRRAGWVVIRVSWVQLFDEKVLLGRMRQLVLERRAS